MGKERDRLTRRGLNHFCFGELQGDLRSEPRLRVRIPVNQEHARGLDLLTSPSKDIFSFRVSGEVEVANFATDGHRTCVTPIDIPSLAGLSE